MHTFTQSDYKNKITIVYITIDHPSFLIIILTLYSTFLPLIHCPLVKTCAKLQAIKKRNCVLDDRFPSYRRRVVEWQLTSYLAAFAIGSVRGARHRQELYQLHWKYTVYGTGRSGASRWIRLHATPIVVTRPSPGSEKKNSIACVKFTHAASCNNAHVE